jgi:hypothetical protein
MTFVRTVRWLRASLLALFVVAQVAGFIPLLYDHTLNVYETILVGVHKHPHVKPTVTNPDADPITVRSICMISAALCTRWLLPSRKVLGSLGFALRAFVSLQTTSAHSPAPIPVFLIVRHDLCL